MSWSEVRSHAVTNSWFIGILYFLLLLDCIVVHGVLRDEQQAAIKDAKDTMRLAGDFKNQCLFREVQPPELVAADTLIKDVDVLQEFGAGLANVLDRLAILENELKTHEETIHYGH